MAKKIRVVTAGETPDNRAKPRVVIADNPVIPTRLTEKEIQARVQRRYATSTTFGGLGGMRRFGSDIIDSGTSQFYSPQLSTDFLEKPQNLRERRAFYRFFYNSNEIVGRAIDIHSTLPLSKLRLVPPKGKNPHQNKYVMKFFEDMCENMKLFKTLIEISHEFNLFGNCCHRNAEIKTLNGFKTAENVQVGDLLLTNQGRYRTVLKKSIRPSENILRIRCWKDFRELPITNEHPIEVFRNNNFCFEKAENLTISDYIRVTWPTETEDRDVVGFDYPDKYQKVDGGYELHFKVEHPRSIGAIKARKSLLTWLGSLKEPVIRTRQQLADDFGVTINNLNGIITNLQNELGLKFHERVGATGWQKGSQVRWLPIDTSLVEVTDSYIINKIIYLNSIENIKIDNDFAYLVGFWQGDGTLARDSSRDTWGRGLWQVCFSEKETENINRVRQILIKIFGLDSITEWTSNTITYLKVISNPIFVEWWADNFGETTFGKNNKKIPEWFVKLPVDKLKYFMSGIVDSDGCVSTSGVCKNQIVVASTASRSIMDAVRDIALKCGIVVSYRKSDEHEVILPNGLTDLSSKMYSLTASDEYSCREWTEYANKKIPEDARFSDQDKYWIQTEKGLAFRIRSIDVEDYNDLVYNFEVEEDHTYQVAGFSTHNCFIFCQDNDYLEGLTSEDSSKKKEELKQRSDFLKQKYQVEDKDPLYKGWEKIIILPPDQVRVRKLPLTDEIAIEYVPDPQTKEFIVQGGYSYTGSAEGERKKYDIPADLQDKVRQSGVIPLDTDPNLGSFCFHLARKKSQYEPLGVSMIERCINTLILLDKLRQAQTSIASRHMTPMRIVWAEQLNPEDVDNLREQVDLALVDPDYSIIANYEIHWEEMGSQGRLLDVEAENNAGLDRLLAGLGMTKEILTGEGTYTGSKISLEIMNTEYLLFREIIQDFIENYLFKPIARKKGFIEYDDYGNEILLYPKLSFTRLAIRDNDHFFDAAFQIYQKGSISIDLLLDILNIDPVSTREKLEKDMFTVNDSIFNELLRNLYTNVAAKLTEQTDIADKLAKYMKLNTIPVEEAPPGAKRFSSDKQLISPEDKEKALKLAKVMKHFQDHPELLDKVFNRM